MNPQGVFEIWKTRKSQGDVGPEFADRVMVTIRRRETTRVGILARLQGIGARPWARAAALTVGILLGLARIIAMLHLILLA